LGYYPIYKTYKENSIKGDLVECGVWRGGNLVLFKKLIDQYKLDKSIFAFDTFEGMPEPTKNDYDLKNIKAQQIYNNYKNKDIKWCYSTLEEVKKNILKFF
jgi:O-methyltransferase